MIQCVIITCSVQFTIQSRNELRDDRITGPFGHPASHTTQTMHYRSAFFLLLTTESMSHITIGAVCVFVRADARAFVGKSATFSCIWVAHECHQ